MGQDGAGISYDTSVGAASALEGLTDPFWALDSGWRFTYANDAGLSLLAQRGRDQSLQELIGHSLWDLFPETIGTPFYDHFQHAAAAGRRASFEEYDPRLDRWAEVRLYPSPAGLTVLWHDITERKGTEQSLQHAAAENAARFHAVYQQSPIAICISRLSDGLFVDVNEAFLAMFGYERSQVVGHTSAEINTWADYEQREVLVRRLLEQRVLPPTDYRYRRRSGEICDGVLSAAIARIDEVDYIVAEMFDSTERKRVEQARDRALAEAREHAAHFRAIFDSELVGASLSRLDTGQFIDCNDAFLSLIGYTRDEVIGHSSLEFQLWADAALRRSPAEHDLHHGGEVSLILGMNGLPTTDI